MSADDDDALAATIGALVAQDFEVAAERLTALLADAEPGTGAELRERARTFEAAARQLSGGAASAGGDAIGSPFPDPDALPPPQAALARAHEYLVAGQQAEALAELDVAEREARRAEDTSAYVTARLATAQLHEAAGQREAAYLAVATGWATLRAGVGPEIARAAFEPAMAGLLARWGVEEFERVRAGATRQRQG